MDGHAPAARYLAEQEFVGQRLFDVFLDDACQRPGTESRIMALFSEPCSSRLTKLDLHAAIGKLIFQLHDKFIDHLRHDFRRQTLESDDGIKPVAKFGREHAFDRFFIVAHALAALETNGRLRELRRTCIGRHDQNDVTKIDRLAIMVG